MIIFENLFEVRARAAKVIFVGVDKTRNMEHSGTCRNIPEHEKIKVIFMKKNIN